MAVSLVKEYGLPDPRSDRERESDAQYYGLTALCVTVFGREGDALLYRLGYNSLDAFWDFLAYRDRYDNYTGKIVSR